MSDYSKDNRTVIIGLHDGRLMLNSSIEVTESIIMRLQFLAKSYGLQSIQLIDAFEDVAFNKTECNSLIAELELLRNKTDDKLIVDLISKILDMANSCISRNNKRIKLYVAGN